MDTLKAEQLSSHKWRVLAIPFGGPKNGKDTDGEFFSPRTDIKSGWFKERPVLWHHAGDDEVGDDAIGIEGELKKETDGHWAEMWLDRAGRYWEQIDAWLRAGKVYGSSGALGHLVRKDYKSGEILVWPHIEQTLTLTPANPFARVVPVKAARHFDEAGIGLEPAMRGLLLEPNDPPTELRTELAPAGDDAARLRALGLAAASAAVSKHRNLNRKDPT